MSEITKVTLACGCQWAEPPGQPLGFWVGDHLRCASHGQQVVTSIRLTREGTDG